MSGSPAACVLRGSAAMDRADPGWWHPGVPGAIDLTGVQPEDPSLCLLARRYGAEPSPGPGDPHGAALTAVLAHLGIPPASAAAYGFTAEPGGPLTLTWLLHISARRNQLHRVPT